MPTTWRWTSVEARALLEAEHVHLDDAELAALVERTEGWPVGLYLAALAFNARGQRLTDRRARSAVTTGCSPTTSAAEVLARLPAETMSFLTRTSILDRMTGPLCDAVLAETGSQDVLESLERNNLLVIPLDRARQSYRYHHLFRELLHGELVRDAVRSAVAELHSRAATWFEADGQPELALAHAQEAGDADRAARLTAALVRGHLRLRADRHGAALADVVRGAGHGRPLPAGGGPRVLDGGQRRHAGGGRAVGGHRRPRDQRRA